MTQSPTTALATVHAALLDALCSATSHNHSDGVAPAAVLWTDRERHWESVIPRLRGELPLLTLGPHAPEALTGPAIWLQCVIACTLPEVEPPEGTPVIYLPGVNRAEFRAVDDCPKDLEAQAPLTAVTLDVLLVPEPDRDPRVHGASRHLSRRAWSTTRTRTATCS